MRNYNERVLFLLLFEFQATPLEGKAVSACEPLSKKQRIGDIDPGVYLLGFNFILGQNFIFVCFGYGKYNLNQR